MRNHSSVKGGAILAWALLLITFLFGLNFGRMLVKKLGSDRHEGSMQRVFLFRTSSPPHALTSPPIDTSAPAVTPAEDANKQLSTSKQSRGYVQPLLPPHVMNLLNSRDTMVDLSTPMTLTCSDPITEKDSTSNFEFLKFFSRVFKEKFDNLPWWLDEGGLIGASRAGAMTNADDDFDFMMILPNQHAPCRPDSLTCTADEFQVYIHKFLMVFWNEGLCINKFHPDPRKFKSKGRLMYSFQLNRPDGVDPEQCFHEGKPFAHMHLGIFTDDGLLETNVWAKHTTHPIDRIPLGVVLPVRRCRVGHMDAPCPYNVTEFLTIRNRGEYRKQSSDGSCLLVKQKWGAKRKRDQVMKTLKLHECGYNSMIDLVQPFVASNFTAC